MKAVQHRQVGGRPEVVDIADLTSAPGQVLLDVTAPGPCHCDDHVTGRAVVVP